MVFDAGCDLFDVYATAHDVVDFGDLVQIVIDADIFGDPDDRTFFG